jgi:hypothetical protein
MSELFSLIKTDQQIELYLDAYDRLIANAEFYATLDPPMDAGEQMDAHMAFMQYWGQRHLLGDLYRVGRLTPEQAGRLAELDRQLLERAAAVETVYGPTLHDLLRDLFTWGTPLAGQSGTLRIETTVTALTELAGITLDVHRSAEVQPA